MGGQKLLIRRLCLKDLPSDLNVKYGLYGGIRQYYIEGVDGTLAQLGSKLPMFDQLGELIKYVANQRKRDIKLLKQMGKLA